MPHPLALNLPQNDQVWLIIGVGGMVVLYLLLRPKGKRPDPLATAPKFSLARQREVEGQMQNLLVELSEMARQITAQLDTRAAKLELLIKEADEKLEALRKAGAPPLTPLPPPPPELFVPNDAQPEAEAPAAPLPPAAPEMDRRHAEVYRLADEGQSAIEIARRVNRPTGEVELILALRQR